MSHPLKDEFVMRFAMIVGIAFVVAGCSQTSLSLSLVTGDITATVEMTDTQNISTTVTEVREAMKEACAANGMKLMEPPSAAPQFLEDLSAVLGILTKLGELLPSHTVTLQGRCVSSDS